MSTILDSPVEHYDAFAMRFQNGAIGTMAGGSAHLGYDDNEHELTLRAIGSDGHFTCDLHREFVSLYRPDGTDLRLPVNPGDGLYNCDGPPDTLINLALGKRVPTARPASLAHGRSRSSTLPTEAPRAASPSR